jgi:hypothetical protein
MSFAVFILAGRNNRYLSLHFNSSFRTRQI